MGDDESVDQHPTFEAFLLVAGASTMAFGSIFDVPFIVAPSVLYSARETRYGDERPVRSLFRSFFDCSEIATIYRSPLLSMGYASKDLTRLICGSK